MMINGLPNVGAPTKTTKTAAKQSANRGGFGTAVTQTQAQRHFDQVSIQTEGSFRKELQSRISQEVRCATTTGTIAALREQVQKGSYQVDANEIARRIMFIGEA